LPANRNTQRKVRIAEAEESQADLGHAADEDLVAGILCASEAHFQQLYDRFFHRVYGFVYNRVRHNADVEEIVQETFTAVFESIGNYRGKSSLLSWVFGIARNTANSTLRSAKFRTESMDQFGPELNHLAFSSTNCSPEEQLNMRRSADAICERLESVSSWQSEIFRMRHLEDLSIKEICERTDRSSDAVRSSLYRVKSLLLEGMGTKEALDRSASSRFLGGGISE